MSITDFRIEKSFQVLDEATSILIGVRIPKLPGHSELLEFLISELKFAICRHELMIQDCNCDSEQMIIHLFLAVKRSFKARFSIRPFKWPLNKILLSDE